jgi:hypothetical protein
MTFDFPQNDLKMAEYVTAKATEIGKADGRLSVDALSQWSHSFRDHWRSVC